MTTSTATCYLQWTTAEDYMTESMFVEKYRPTKLSDMVGQDRAKRTVSAWLKTSRVPRTILITGDTSTGKTTISRIIARALLCKEPVEGDACGKCSSCKSFDKKTHSDFVEKDAASDRGIDAMREISKNATLRPYMGKRKVVVLDECHAITAPAFQALLKTLEEPPEHICFILVTTNPEKIPTTVLGRCSRLPLNHTTVEDCTTLLERVSEDVDLAKAGITREHLEKISMAVNAHPREALHTLDQVYSWVLDASGGSTAVDAATVNAFIEDAAVTDVEAAASTIVRGILDGSPGGAMKMAETMTSQADVLLTQINKVLRQAMMKAVSPRLFDTRFESVFEGLEIFTHKKNRSTILDAYGVFTQLRISCSNNTVNVSEVLDESIVRAAFICRSFLAANKPKKEEAT